MKISAAAAMAFVAALSPTAPAYATSQCLNQGELQTKWLFITHQWLLKPGMPIQSLLTLSLSLDD